jgi:hypothetical protein
MPSFDVVNYSLRPNKSIQRTIVFEAVSILQGWLRLENLLYIGFGSIWFTDFQLAHKFLRVKELISIEASEIGYKRALFNQPFKCIRIEKGQSNEVLPALISERALSNRPWFVWLDYDDALSESKAEDIRCVVESAPPDSIIIVTLPAAGRPLGRPTDRPERIRTILGSVVPDDLTEEACDSMLSDTLLTLISDYMAAVAAAVARPGGFIRAFRIAYRDGTPMITIGGILPAKGSAPNAKAAVESPEWPALLTDPIETPPLTLKEVAVLQSQLPRKRGITRKAIRRLGLDLEEAQLRSFEKFYRYYPIFAQIST